MFLANPHVIPRAKSGPISATCWPWRRFGSYNMRAMLFLSRERREMERVLGVRKGAWTEGEDVLLRRCIETHGEGNWHQIPLRAGLNRCRKSCRLRWLNYLKPNIKRGEFEEDEVDLLTKLHKLLGNRWSMIAGRLPGRTTNDVKNYWNTNLRKRKVFSRERKDSKFANNAELIRPQPRTFSKSFILSCTSRLQELTQKKERPTISFQSPSPSPSHALASDDPWSPENGKEWWETVLAEVAEGGGEAKSLNDVFAVGGSELDPPSTAAGEAGDSVLGATERLCWSDMQFDNEVWDFL